MNGKLCPSEPPSIFSHLPKSVIPTAPSKPRRISRYRFENRTAVADQYAQFKKKDNITFEVLSKEAVTRVFTCPIVSYKIGDSLYLQSCSYFSDAVPSFLIKVTEDLKYDAYQAGIRCNIQSLSTKRIDFLNSWSKVEKVVCFLKNRPVTHKMLVMKEHLDVMGTQKCGEKTYSSDAAQDASPPRRAAARVCRGMKVAKTHQNTKGPCVCFFKQRGWASGLPPPSTIEAGRRHREQPQGPVRCM